MQTELSLEAKLHFAFVEGRHCKRPSRGASRDLLRELHRRKMMGKFFRNQEPADTGLTSALARGRRIRPNMSDRTLAAHFKRSK